jgi:glycerol-3-phosphate dehydrogenase (NAD(P)+)
VRANAKYKVGLIGSGSWATAIAKILTENNFRLHWWFHQQADVERFLLQHHNPRYLSSVHFDVKKLVLTTDIEKVIHESEWIVICIPSAFLKATLEHLPKNIFREKFIVSGIKGMIPEANLLLNDYLIQEFDFPLKQYFSITGPCHAEEVATEKLSYITISGKDFRATRQIAGRFTTRYLKTIVNGDVWGAQYAAVLKNIYAIGAGIAHGLGYGDNFLSVYIANCANEMTLFNQAVCQLENHVYEDRNAFASAYLGDLLVTCYSQYSRNRTFGNMIGKGYSVRSAQLELNMIAEGYYAVKCIKAVNAKVQAPIPIADILYEVLWNQLAPQTAITALEKLFI